MNKIFALISENIFLITSLTFLIIFIWMSILTFIFWRQNSFLKRAFKGASGEDLKQILNKHLSQIRKLSQELESQENKIQQIRKDNIGHFQKIGFIRFNPYKETGGDQSFVFAFLDQENNGVVVSSLHGRNQTRVFAKRVKKGKPQKHSFSKEEQEAVDQACQS